MGQKTLKTLRKLFTKNGVVNPRFKEIKKKYDALPAPERHDFLQNSIDLVRNLEQNLSRVKK